MLVNEGDEIMLITNGGTLVRTRVADVSQMGRDTQGVTMIRLSKVFPTLDCASCITTPKMAAAAHHDNITLFTYCDITALDRQDGRLTAAVTAVVCASNVSISLIRNLIPPQIRIIVQLAVIASLPPDTRMIPVRVETDFVKKARGLLEAEGREVTTIEGIGLLDALEKKWFEDGGWLIQLP